ncbi:hypothetical protein ACWEPL_62690 [Nonomuraea sp. NPDC004186]|uniref:hypothetical protein n=1 Tax=Nonomuraea sp. NPDC049625 TaxID=3155775 RepID=UPI00342B34F9
MKSAFFSVDGRLPAAVGQGEVKIVDAAAGTVPGELVAFFPDGKKPAFASADQRLLDAVGGQDPNTGQLQSIAFTADGADVVTLDLNGMEGLHPSPALPQELPLKPATSG